MNQKGMSYIVLTTDITVENHKFHFKMNFKSQKTLKKKLISGTVLRQIHFSCLVDFHKLDVRFPRH